MNGRAVALAVVIASALCAGAARAADAPEKQQCLVTYEAAQALVDEHKLTKARRALMVCVHEACPAPLRKDCLQWLSDVDARQPTAVFRTVDESGRDVVDARVLVDGALLTRELGVAIAVDPGAHEVVIEAEQWLSVKQQVVFSEGEKNRLLVFRLRPRAGDAQSIPGTTGVTSSGSRSVPLLSYVFGGVGIVSLGAFGYLGLTGDADYERLETGCGRTGSCAASDVDSVRTKLLVADVALGVGILALGGAALAFLLQKPSDDRATITTRR